MQKNNNTKVQHTYLVTDPCYIIADEDWGKACEDLTNDAEVLEAFNKKIERLLQEVSGHSGARAESTGIGDWSNSMFGRVVTNSGFSADAGMVCFVEETPQLLKYWKEHNVTPPAVSICAATLSSENELKAEMDTSNPSWTVVRVLDGDDIVAESLPAEEEEEEDDEY